MIIYDFDGVKVNIAMDAAQNWVNAINYAFNNFYPHPDTVTLQFHPVDESPMITVVTTPQKAKDFADSVERQLMEHDHLERCFSL